MKQFIMQQCSDLKPEELKRAIAYWRRFYDRVWLAVAGVMLLGFTITWGFTRNIDHLYAGLFYAAFPLIGLIWSHWVLLNPHRDPVKTTERLERLAVKQRKNVRAVGLVNGTIMLLFSPLFWLLGISAGAEQYGWIGAVVGGLFGLLWTAGAVALIAWARRQPT